MRQIFQIKKSMKVEMWNKIEGAPLMPVERDTDVSESESEDEKTSEPDEKSDVEETTEIDRENLQVTDSGSEDEKTSEIASENSHVIESDSEDMIGSDSDSDEPRKEVVREEVEILEDLQMTVQDAGLDLGQGILFEQKAKIKK